MLDDRDTRILEAFDRLGPDVPHVLLHHPSTDGFASFDEVEGRIEVLESSGYLEKRSVEDVTGDELPEYDTAPGWEERLEGTGLEAPSR